MKPPSERAKEIAESIHADYKDLADAHTGNDFNCSCPSPGQYETDEYCPNLNLKRTLSKIESALISYAKEVTAEKETEINILMKQIGLYGDELNKRDGELSKSQEVVGVLNRQLKNYRERVREYLAEVYAHIPEIQWQNPPVYEAMKRLQDCNITYDAHHAQQEGK